MQPIVEDAHAEHPMLPVADVVCDYGVQFNVYFC